MISIRGLKKTYEESGPSSPVLQGMDLEVKKGEWVAVIGASGSGKSTLLHIIAGLDERYDGEVQVAGHTLNGLDDTALSDFRSRSVGLVFQSFHLIPQLSALDNVALPGFFRKNDAPNRADARARAAALLDDVGLSTKQDRTPAQLSGGERQRVAIARALFFKPPLLLCDEPTGNLDAATGKEIIDLFHALHAKGQTLLAVTHEERLSKVAQRVLRLENGRLAV